MDETNKKINLEDEKIKEITNQIRKEGKKTFPVTMPPFPSERDEEPESVAVPEPVIKPLRTYEGDIAETMREKKTSVISIAIEENKKERERQIEDEKPAVYSKNSLIVIISALLVLGGFAAFATFFAQKSKTKPVRVEQIYSIIFVDISKDIDAGSLDRDAAIRAFKELGTGTSAERGQVLRANFILGNAVVKKPFSVKNFLSLFSKDIPQSLLRSFDDIFTAGFYFGETVNPFILIKTASFDSAFGGMLRWEQTMALDLAPLFENPASGNFEDVIIKNKDTRVIRDSSGKIAFIYSFLNNHSILITTSEASFKEILNRVTASAIIR